MQILVNVKNNREQIFDSKDFTYDIVESIKSILENDEFDLLKLKTQTKLKQRNNTLNSKIDKIVGINHLYKKNREKLIDSLKKKRESNKLKLNELQSNLEMI